MQPEQPTVSTLERASTTYPDCDTPDFIVGEYTIASCNVGAKTEGRNAESGDNVGFHFQRGNNYGRLLDSSPENNSGDEAINTLQYGPRNPYAQRIWITVNPRDITPSNKNLRGGLESGDSLRQGPCRPGYHVPTAEERQGVLDIIDSKIEIQLSLPFGGGRSYASTLLTNVGLQGIFRSSIRNVNQSAYALNVSEDIASVIEFNVSNGANVRCFLDRTMEPEETIFTGTITIAGYPAACENKQAMNVSTGNVTLLLNITSSNTTIEQMRFRTSNTGNNYTEREPYATTKKWTLQTGTNQIYVEFQDDAGQIASGCYIQSLTYTPITEMSLEVPCGRAAADFFADTGMNAVSLQCGQEKNTTNNKDSFTATSSDEGATWSPTGKRRTYDTTAGECTFICAEGYTRDEETNACGKEIACIGDLPKNAEANGTEFWRGATGDENCENIPSGSEPRRRTPNETAGACTFVCKEGYTLEKI